MAKSKFTNPFRPGAGHMPPYLAGRRTEKEQFLKLLEQEVVLENLVLTGLRGVGKTVLLDKLKPLAMEAKWLWVGTDLSETASVSEDQICTRLIADLSVVTGSLTLDQKTDERHMGFGPAPQVERKLTFGTMLQIFNSTPGLPADKLKALLEIAWNVLKGTGMSGIVFAYDEAQNMTDHAASHEYPLSLMLDVFQSIQRKGVPFMLLLTGLPTLFPKLVEARTYSERMFHVVFLDRLNHSESHEAIVRPVKDLPTQMSDESVELVIKESGGYPYFLQFICREVYDVFLRHPPNAEVTVPTAAVKRKLDADFFAGRWAKASDRQRELLFVVAHLPNCEKEFTIREVADCSQTLPVKSFSSSHISSMFIKLSEAGLVYKNRHGKYAFAVPMMGEFILRQADHLDLE